MKRKIFLIFFKLIVLWLITLWVFWESGHAFSYPDIKKAFLNPHTIDLVEVVNNYYFPTIIVISLFMNLMAITYLRAFYVWVRDGKIRIGGKAGND